MVFRLLSLQAPGIWLLFSIITSLLSLILWQRAQPHWRAPFVIVIWIGIPYLGLLLGGLSPRLLGLSNIDWFISLGLGLGLIFVMLLLLMLVRATMSVPTRSNPPASIEVTTWFYQLVQHGAEE